MGEKLNRCINGQEVHEKLLNTNNHQRNENQKHSEISSYYSIAALVLFAE